MSNYEMYREMMENDRARTYSSQLSEDAKIHALLSISAGLCMIAEAILEKHEIEIADIPLKEFEQKFGKGYQDDH